MTALPQLKSQIQHQTQNHLRSCCLMTDGNTHLSDSDNQLFHHTDLLCEAMLPTIRIIATMIATQRHDFKNKSPEKFTEHADWFAARILVLQARVFHLEIKHLNMLQLANQRAQAFAQKHGLPFQPACIRASLHNTRPNNMLLIECDLPSQKHTHFIKNTLFINEVSKKRLSNILTAV